MNILKDEKKAIISTLKGSLFVFIFIFIIIFLLTKFCGGGDIIQPGSAPHKCKPISFKETFEYLPSIVIFSLGGALISFIVFYPSNLHELKKNAELKRKEEDEDSSEASEKEKTNTIKK